MVQISNFNLKLVMVLTLEFSDAIEMLIPFPNNDIQQITQYKERNIIWKA